MVTVSVGRRAEDLCLSPEQSHIPSSPRASPCLPQNSTGAGSTTTATANQGAGGDRRSDLWRQRFQHGVLVILSHESVDKPLSAAESGRLAAAGHVAVGLVLRKACAKPSANFHVVQIVAAPALVALLNAGVAVRVAIASILAFAYRQVRIAPGPRVGGGRVRVRVHVLREDVWGVWVLDETAQVFPGGRRRRRAGSGGGGGCGCGCGCGRGWR